jgi:hypothetical protein
MIQKGAVSNKCLNINKLNKTKAEIILQLNDLNALNIKAGT